VSDDGTNTNQADPAIGVDHYGQPYLVWTDYRRSTTEIYSAATTLADPIALDSQVVAASVGATLGADPAAIRAPQDVSLVVPPGAFQADLRMAISSILNPQVSADALLGSYEFGPGGMDFDQPVTVTIPYAVSSRRQQALPYWYDSVTGTLSQQGITGVQNVYISSRLNALRFRTTHFAPFYIIKADAQVSPSLSVSGTAGGDDVLATTGNSSPGQSLAP
jgi:hypothetical protein